MRPELSVDKNRKGIMRLFSSAKNSIQGITYAYKYEKSFLLHTIFLIISIIIGFFFKISFIEWLIIGGLNLLLIVIELLNTSVEATVDMITTDFHPLAKIAKDCGSAATFIVIIATLIAELIIFIPYIERL